VLAGNPNMLAEGPAHIFKAKTVWTQVVPVPLLLGPGKEQLPFALGLFGEGPQFGIGTLRVRVCSARRKYRGRPSLPSWLAER
jgi:hypothetical protein